MPYNKVVRLQFAYTLCSTSKAVFVSLISLVQTRDIGPRLLLSRLIVIFRLVAANEQFSHSPLCAVIILIVCDTYIHIVLLTHALMRQNSDVEQKTSCSFQKFTVKLLRCYFNVPNSINRLLQEHCSSKAVSCLLLEIFIFPLNIYLMDSQNAER